MNQFNITVYSTDIEENTIWYYVIETNTKIYCSDDIESEDIFSLKDALDKANHFILTQIKQ